MHTNLPTRPPGSVAIAWVLAWPGVTGTIADARSAEQVDGWIGAAALEVSAADLNGIASAIARTGAGAGPLRSAPMRHVVAI
jgi:aryl-alcohol dehydrogenase-like predicted oxidoreductase